MAIERPVSGLVVRNAYHCILIPFPKDHRDVSTRELGEKTAYIKHSGREIQSSHIVRLEKKKKRQNPTFLATTPGPDQSRSTPSWAGVGGQSPKPWSFASINSS